MEWKKKNNEVGSQFIEMTDVAWVDGNVICKTYDCNLSDDGITKLKIKKKHKPFHWLLIHFDVVCCVFIFHGWQSSRDNQLHSNSSNSSSITMNRHMDSCKRSRTISSFGFKKKKKIAIFSSHSLSHINSLQLERNWWLQTFYIVSIYIFCFYRLLLCVVFRGRCVTSHIHEIQNE